MVIGGSLGVLLASLGVPRGSSGGPRGSLGAKRGDFVRLGWSLGPAQHFVGFSSVFGSEFFFFHVVFQCQFCSNIYKTESFSVVIVGGQHVSISLVLKLFVKCKDSSQPVFFRFSLIRLEEILNSYEVDLAHENKYNWDHCIVFCFFTCCFVNMIENHEFPRLDLAYEHMYICTVV